MRQRYVFVISTLTLLVFLNSGCVCLRSQMKTGEAVSSAKSADGRTVVSGKVYAPLEKAFVSIYREGDDLHGPDFATSEATDAQGNFSMELPPGKYYLVARRRLQGGERGPLHLGDLKSEIIPFTVKAGCFSQVEFNCKVKDDNEEMYNISGTQKTETAISGEIRNTEGKTVSGIRVHVYQYIQMSERPKFISMPTGPDGKFTVYLPKGGTYYICARDSFGGPPKLGDLYGRYDGGALNPSAVVLNNGEKLTDVNIIVQQVW